MRSAIYIFWGTASVLIYGIVTLGLVYSFTVVIPLVLEFFPKMSEGKNFLLALLASAALIIVLGIALIWLVVTIAIVAQSRRTSHEVQTFQNPTLIRTFFGDVQRSLASLVVILGLIFGLPFLKTYGMEYWQYRAPLSDPAKAILAEPTGEQSEIIADFMIRFRSPESFNAHWSYKKTGRDRKIETECSDREWRREKNSTCRFFTNVHGVKAYEIQWFGGRMTRSKFSYPIHAKRWVIPVERGGYLHFNASDLAFTYRSVLRPSEKNNPVEHVRVGNEVGRTLVESVRIEAAAWKE